MQAQLLKDHIARKQLAVSLDKSEKTLIRWEQDGKGPPVTRMGRDVLYYVPSVEKWLRSQEHAPSAACDHASRTSKRA